LDSPCKIASLARARIYLTTREILFVLHDSVADSNAWWTPRIYHNQQYASSKYYESIACQCYSKLQHGLLQPAIQLCNMEPIAQQMTTRTSYITSLQAW
jgi:hypothetical protein